MGLIDKEALLNKFNNTGANITFDLPVEELLGEDVDIDDFTMLVQDAIQVYRKMVMDTINNQPTAYDIDKVIEELEEYKSFVIRNGIMGIEAAKKAIEIVKQGGTENDDACEWESDYKFHSDKYKRETSCGYEFYDIHHAIPFKYCPYCGKKIKEMEDK